MKGRFLEYLLSQPLLCTPEAARVAASIAAREDTDGVEREAVAAKPGTPMDGARGGMERRNGVAIIPVMGPISRYADLFTRLCGGTTVDALAEDLNSAMNDATVRAILLDVDSPGGEAAGIGEFAAMVRKANGMKPVCAYVGNQAASAAYWIASAAGSVVCSESAELGSIGCVMGMTVKGDRAGTKTYEWVSSQSPMKRADPATETGKANYQQRCDDLAGVFIEHVAAYRGTTPDNVMANFGRGGCMIGRKAVAAGMADDIGDFETTLDRLACGMPAVEPKPKPAGKGKPKPSKGASMFNPLSVLAKLWAADPEAVQSAMAETDKAPDMGAFLASFGKPAENPTAPTVDSAAIRAEIEAKVKADFAAEQRTALAGVFATQGQKWAASVVKAEKIKPADAGVYAALYSDFCMSDNTGLLSFKATGELEPAQARRLDFLVDTVESRTPTKLTAEFVAAEGSEVSERLKNFKVLPPAETDADDKAKAASDRRVAEMLATLKVDAAK